MPLNVLQAVAIDVARRVPVSPPELTIAARLSGRPTNVSKNRNAQFTYLTSQLVSDCYQLGALYDVCFKTG
jgi:hypothetical protein